MSTVEGPGEPGSEVRHTPLVVSGAATGAPRRLDPRMPDLDYTIRRSPRARRIRVKVDPHDGVEVVIPQRATHKQAEAAIAELRPWIDRRLAEAEQARAHLASPPGTVPFLGTHLRLRREAGRTRAHRKGDELHLPSHGTHEALERWYRAQARREIAPRLGRAVEAVGGRAPVSLAIRNQRTRWGSCSSTGTMSFNWRLVLAPEPVLDYVVWHEACHLVVMDHSRRFWALVERHVPDYREPRRWLRRNGAALVLPPLP
jgi:predicted metal-dependent hydrolase